MAKGKLTIRHATGGTGYGAELFVTPSGTEVASFTRRDVDGQYIATARGWKRLGASAHKVKAALIALLAGRGWEVADG